MAKKGLLAGDLPGPSQGLEGESTMAMADGVWGKAYLAASQLAATVDAIKVDRSFIMGKYNRLQGRIGSTKVDDASIEGMKDVMQKYGDGDFASANRKLNQLLASVK